MISVNAAFDIDWHFGCVKKLVWEWYLLLFCSVGRICGK
jgi:hypothetical protein